MSLNPQINAAFRIARQFGARPDEKQIFTACWKWRTRVDRLYRHEQARIAEELERQVAMVVQAIKGSGPSGQPGHRYLYRGETHRQKYVIFSDHHLATSAHRQDFFAISGNRELYCELLEEYYDEGYLLIENGDVEELVIFEPTLEEVRRRAAMPPEALHRYRLVERRKLLQRILDEPGNARLYTTLRKFHEAGRFIRIVGNHDYDLQDPSLLEVFRQAFPGIGPPYDYALLEQDGQVAYCVIHGHHFDASTNPVYAPRGGETISESMSWAYQGPDRNWRWDGQAEYWGTGSAPFNNLLVHDEQVPHRGGLFDKLSLVLGSLHSKEAWEAIFKHNVAWEYFNCADPQQAVNQEVKTGKQWFKFRHLDELFLMRALNKHFEEAHRPTLVLGHTHEVRLGPGYPGSDGLPTGPYPWIINTGAAGRFENLIWGLEIVDGQPRMISWSRPSPGSGPPQRRVYTPEAAPPFRLWACQDPIPLTARPERSP